MDHETFKKAAIEEENDQLSNAIRSHLESRVVSLNVQLQESRLENENLRRKLSGESDQDVPSGSEASDD